jgi:hypothetical protein
VIQNTKWSDHCKRLQFLSWAQSQRQAIVTFAEVRSPGPCQRLKIAYNSGAAG